MTGPAMVRPASTDKWKAPHSYLVNGRRFFYFEETIELFQTWIAKVGRKIKYHWAVQFDLIMTFFNVFQVFRRYFILPLGLKYATQTNLPMIFS